MTHGVRLASARSGEGRNELAFFFRLADPARPCRLILHGGNVMPPYDQYAGVKPVLRIAVNGRTVFRGRSRLPTIKFDATSGEPQGAWRLGRAPPLPFSAAAEYGGHYLGGVARRPVHALGRCRSGNLAEIEQRALMQKLIASYIHLAAKPVNARAAVQVHGRAHPGFVDTCIDAGRSGR